MKHRKLLLSMTVLSILLVSSCSDSGDDPDLCQNGPEISIDAVVANIAGKTTGSITASATGGSGSYTYSIDGTNFQSSGLFENLAGGNYTVEVKDGNDCMASEVVTVEEIQEVFYANQIRPILDQNCQVSNCHGSNANIPSFATYDDAKAKASAIKFRTGNGSMPPNGSLSDGDIKLIADWVDIGAPEN